MWDYIYCVTLYKYVLPSHDDSIATYIVVAQNDEDMMKRLHASIEFDDNCQIYSIRKLSFDENRVCKIGDN